MRYRVGTRQVTANRPMALHALARKAGGPRRSQLKVERLRAWFAPADGGDALWLWLPRLLVSGVALDLVGAGVLSPAHNAESIVELCEDSAQRAPR